MIKAKGGYGKTGKTLSMVASYQSFYIFFQDQEMQNVSII